ncbi:histidine kinase [[Leptolyngbya] sp. PCC 7376]|uniref:response regulator n=1 Tax=[Leptolyngbya] sp. PCC 7376 TaxID=111781 RepID=UPI00029EFEAB|nr:response regulator [[Leptolyngbya] sp. PCC 7376]AFY37984.1 histidine kinase [[Leptolyngbya] sp. PCC 7376]
MSSQDQEIRRLSFLLGLAERLQSVTSVKDIGKYALKYLVDNMGAAFGDIKLISGQGDRRRANMLTNGMSSEFIATYGEAVIADMTGCLDAGIPYGEGLLWKVVETGEPYFVDDYANHPDAVEAFRYPKIGSLGMFPIKDQKGLILAVLTLESRTDAPLKEAPLQNVLIAACQILGAAIERAQSQEQLKRTNQELEKVSRLKSEFLASMSHELRTPLNSVIGFSDLLRRQAEQQLDDRQRSYIDTIEKSGQHLLALINDILDLSKIEAGKTELNISSVNIIELCQECLTMIQPRAKAKKIQLTLDVSFQVDHVYCDRRKVQQILINLLSNAVKFTPKKGNISLSARLAYGEELLQEKRLDSSVIEGSTPYLRLEVADTGIGISLEAQIKLFQPFFQIDGKLTRQYDGTGLGLALTKRLAELHGGEASVESIVDQGSCFRVWLPLTLSPAEGEMVLPTRVPQPLVTAATEEDKTRLKPEQKFILVVEDKPFNQTLITEILGLHDYQVEIIDDGQQMLDRLQADGDDRLPDLILMDIQLPHVDGLTLTKTIKQSPQWQKIPVVIITALAMTGDRERCLAAGADDYISKPIQIIDLEDKLSMYL